MDYRAYYEKCTQRKLPDDFDIHHIDFNRENNVLKNLVAIPTDLHNKFHAFSFSQSNMIELNSISSAFEGGSVYNEFIYLGLQKYIPIYNEMNKWCDYKYYLLGFIRIYF